ncbi:MAG: site-2 protease family protein [Nanoarchaeota archaeon]
MKSKFKTSETEIKHIIIALIVLAIAFSFVLFSEEIFRSGSFFSYTPQYFFYTLIAVGFAFVLHELAHKFVAQRYGFWAEFRMWPAGLFFAVMMAFIFKGGFVFAAPGATMIAPVTETKNGFAMKKIHITSEKMGKISLAGPITNNLLTLAFIALSLLAPMKVFETGAYVNSWLAIFNLLPFAVLDGKKIWAWNKAIWISAMLLSIGLFIISGLVGAV